MGRNEKGGSGTHRLERVEKEIRDVVGTYLIGGFRGDLPGLVSLTRVRLSADLKIANLNFTLLLTQDEGESAEAYEKRSAIARREAEQELNAHARDVQAEIAHRLKMRFTPRVHFYYDEGFESALKVEKILRDMSVAAGRGDDLPATKFTDDSADQESASDDE
jgi:ribosome-binding factor A